MLSGGALGFNCNKARGRTIPYSVSKKFTYRYSNSLDAAYTQGIAIEKLVQKETILIAGYSANDVVGPVLALIAQNSFLIVLMRYTLINQKLTGPYLSSTAVLFSELLKLLLSMLLVYRVEANKNMDTFFSLVWEDSSKEDILALTIPAFLYILQNNLQYLAVGNLSPAVFQVLYQMKIVTAALFSYFILNRTLYAHQWLSIMLLMLGLALTQLSQNVGISTLVSKACTPVGFAAVTLSALTSGMAGVYTERLLKSEKSNSTVWVRNIQMAGIGVLISILSCLKDLALIQARSSLFFGYTPFVWATITLQAVGGLIVSLVVRKTDNLVKGFATSLSIILSCLLSSLLFNDVTLSGTFVLGAATVILSTFWYGMPVMPVVAAKSKVI